MKIVALDRKYWPRGGYGHWCPACGSGHEIDTELPNSSGAKWSFNGNLDRPTFSPSINMRMNTPDMGKHYQADIASTICHYFITDGKIIYCGDCTHAKKGQTCDLPDLPAHAYLSSRHGMK